MLVISPKSALAHGELGTVYATMGRRQEAIHHLGLVIEYEPADAYGLIQLAGMALAENRAGDAAALCARADPINPASLRNHFLWGQALLKQERWADAGSQFRLALRNDPTHAASNDGLSVALRRQGQAAEAVRFGRRGAYWSGGPDAELLLNLAEAYAAANRRADAQDALARALEVANQSNTALAPTIRARQHELRK
jgi:tetratricopeptide (TPR) repeat protein